MGIPSYFSFIVKNHANIIKRLTHNTIKINNVSSPMKHPKKRERKYIKNRSKRNDRF